MNGRFVRLNRTLCDGREKDGVRYRDRKTDRTTTGIRAPHKGRIRAREGLGQVTALCSSDALRLYRPDSATGELAARIGCSFLTAAVLRSRECSSAAPACGLGRGIPQFLEEGALEEMLDGLQLGDNAAESAARWKGLRTLGRVLVYGDYDADGVSSTTLALELCRGRAEQARFFIPHRHDHGYGLHGELLDRLMSFGWDTLVVTDCGTKDAELLERVSRSGVNVFVFDHHLPEPGAAPHPCVVNPHASRVLQPTESGGLSLCATGVLWAWAWQHEIVPRSRLAGTTDLVALATIADCVPLTPLNRALVRRGMDRISRSPRPGLARLLSKLGITAGAGGLTEETLSMKVIPCINAAGRMDTADTAVDVLLGSTGLDDSVEALVALNRKRQSLSLQISEDASGIVAEGTNVILGESWPVGILSGVASRICSRTGAPVALAAPVSGGIRGTLRVPEGGDAVGVLGALSARLNAWGGHRYAAGFSVSRENWTRVQRDLQVALASMKIDEPVVTAIAMEPCSISMEDWKEASRLGPFGNGNPAPMFFLPRRGSEKLLPLGRDGKHIQIDAAGSRLLVFFAEEEREAIVEAEGWVYRPRLDCWRGEERLQYIVDFAVV